MEELKIFTDYVKANYDFEIKEIKEKYDHSLRVWTLMTYLAMALNLDERSVYLAGIIGLFHDLGRFREVMRNINLEKKFNNRTFDHGAYSNKIMFNDGLVKLFSFTEEEILIIRKALYFHNKKDLLGNFTDRELLFTLMIRDIDKLDLLYIRSHKRVLKLSDNVSENVFINYINGHTIDIQDLKTDTDRIVFYISFISGLTFKESFDYAINNGYLDELLKIIDVNEENKSLYAMIMKKIEERGNKDERTRQKIQSLGSRKG